MRPRESLLHFPVNMFLLHLAAMFDGLTWLILTVVLKTEGVFIMLLMHVFLFKLCLTDSIFC